MADEMDYVMEHSQDNSFSPPPPPPPQQQQQQQPQSPPQQHQHQHQHQQQQQQLDPRAQHQHQQQHIRRCPYWADHPVSAFPGHYGPGLSVPSPLRNHSSSSHQPSPQGSSLSENPPGLATSDARSQATHPYDPVHSSIPALNPSWYPPTPSYHWSPVTLPHPRPSFDSLWQYPNGHSQGSLGSSGARSADPATSEGNNQSNSGNGSSRGGSGGVDRTSQTASSGPVQPPVVQNQQTPRHEPFTPFPIAFHHQSANLHRFNALPPNMSTPNPNQQSLRQTGQQQPSLASASNEFTGIRLPALSPPVLPRPPQSSQQQPQQNLASSATGAGAGNVNSPTNMSDGEEGLLYSSFGSTTRTARPLPEPTRPDRGLFDAATRNAGTPPQASGNAANREGSAYIGSTPDSMRSDNPRRLLGNMRARPGTARPSDSSDYDSEEDAAEEHERAIEFYNQLSSANPNFALRGEDLNEMRIRTQQLLRGQMSTKRVASKSAIASLRSVVIDSLPEKERTCIICYNDFGVQSPEGINEAPLRLPKCKHVFGDHCIKKWFEESDSCPYCRDKVPSEPQYQAGSRAVREQLQRMRDATRQWPTDSHGRPAWGSERRPTTEDDDENSPTARSQIRQLNRAGGDGSPPRAWQTGDRRSPPSSDAADHRRRIRPRHENSRASTGAGNGGAAFASQSTFYNSGNSSTHPYQQNSSRDRFPLGSYRPPQQYGTPDWNPERGRTVIVPLGPLGLNPPVAPNPAMYQGYMPPAFPMQPHGAAFQGQGQTGNTGGAMLPTTTESGQTFLQRAPPSLMDYSFTEGPGGLGFNPGSGNQGTHGTYST